VSQMMSRQIHLAAYADPQGPPPESIFKLVEVALPEPGPGEVLVRNIWMSCDPGARGGMTNKKGERVALYPLDAPPSAGAIGQVVATNHPSLSVGDYVRSSRGWREYFVAPGSELRKWTGQPGASMTSFGALGGAGHTAYVGLMIAGGGVLNGDTVLVSAAAGSVGSYACQIAKLKGARVVGMAGTDEKCSWLKTELGVDATINYRTAGNLSEAVARAAPEGIDLYFENVGGEHLIAAIDNMKMHGRIAVCGLIDRYSESPMPAPDNVVQILYKRLRIQGFIQGDHGHLDAHFEQEMKHWIEKGAIKSFETIYEGIENAPRAYAGLFTGANIGKTLVRLAPDPAI
jgi:NADPH-dependent curcumin reductase CurA